MRSVFLVTGLNRKNIVDGFLKYFDDLEAGRDIELELVAKEYIFRQLRILVG